MIRRFDRYELKYIIDARRYERFVADLTNFMVPDDHGDARGFYRIVSLYYDSPSFEAYRSKVEGLRFRRKLRLRIYPPHGDVRKATEGHVEIKQRMNHTVQKRRLVLPLPVAEALCAGQEPDIPLDELDQAVSSEVHYMVRAQHLRPACIVAYRRQAFVTDRFDTGMRVTFDMQLAGRNTGLRITEDNSNRYFLPLDQFVMEVKVNQRVPHWMVALLSKHECNLQRISKYVKALDHEQSRWDIALAHKEDEPWLI